jgi:hypothetical protein
MKELVKEEIVLKYDSDYVGECNEVHVGWSW